MTVIGNRELYQKSALVSKSNPWVCDWFVVQQ